MALSLPQNVFSLPDKCPRSDTVKFCIILDSLFISDQILFIHVHGTHWLLWDIYASRNTICLVICALKMQQLYKNKPLCLFANALHPGHKSHPGATSEQASLYSPTNMLQSQTRQNNSLAEILMPGLFKSMVFERRRMTLQVPTLCSPLWCEVIF